MEHAVVSQTSRRRAEAVAAPAASHAFSQASVQNHPRVAALHAVTDVLNAPPGVVAQRKLGDALNGGQRLAAQAPPTAASTGTNGAGLEPLGAGAPLDGGTATRMGSAFGEGFGHVRVHTGPAAASSTRALGADAIAFGPHIAFGPGAYRPGTPTGDGLIAHELAHVVQQAGSPPIAQLHGTADSSSSAHERDADRVAAAVVARLHPATTGAGAPAFADQSGDTGGNARRRRELWGEFPSRRAGDSGGCQWRRL